MRATGYITIACLLGAAALLALSRGEAETAILPGEPAQAQVNMPRGLPDSGQFRAKRCINLGNGMEAESEGAWGYTIRHEDFRRIKHAGFDTVRIPVRWDLRTAKRAPYRVDPSYMARVKQVVDQALGEGLGVILDVHHYDDLYAHTRRELPRFLAIWEQISLTFRGAPGQLYFEPINEPFPYGSNAEINRVYRAVIPLIRKYHPNRSIILGGNNWNSVDALFEIDWPRDPNIVATFHDYVPHEFTHQGNSWEGSPPPLGRRWGSKSDIAAMRQDYDKARQFSKQTGLSVFVGEYGVINTVPTAQRAEWMATRRQMIEEAGFSGCVYSFAGSFNIYDIERETWIQPITRAVTGL